MSVLLLSTNSAADEELESLKQGGSAPEWLNANSYKATKKVLLPNETPKDSYVRVAQRFGEISGRKDLVDDLFDALWSSYICLATPVHSNFGTNRGLPISCFMTMMTDTLTDDSGIFPTYTEAAEMSRVGGGVGVDIRNIRARNEIINGNGGVSGGPVPWMRGLDVTFDTVSQALRRGSGSATLSIEHEDWDEFIECRDNTGDPRRRVYDLHLSTNISDAFMRRLLAGDLEARRKWEKLLQYRWETGESYIEFEGNINKDRPKSYIDKDMFITNTNICSEILQFIDEKHSVVCCLSSFNLARYNQWSSDMPRIVDLMHRLLDSVTEEFLQKAGKYKYLEKAARGASKARALGMGVLGWHDLLFQRNLPFDNSMDVMRLNSEIFKGIQEASLQTNQSLAKEYGEPEWLKGYGLRNMFTGAMAPTKSNSARAGAVMSNGKSVSVIGEGIGPCVSNLYEKEGAEGTVYQVNPYLEEVLVTHKKNDYATWKSIARSKGSVQHLTFLTDLERKVFLTAREIDQHKLVRQCAQRQAWIDQGQSLNLWFPENASESYVNSVHLTAYKIGIKTLYYLKSGPAISGDVLDSTCESCEG